MCLDTVLVARDGEVRVNFAVLQIFNTWLRDLWHPGETVLLLHCCCGTGVCDIKSDISIEPDSDYNKNAIKDDIDDNDGQSDICLKNQESRINAARSRY